MRDDFALDGAILLGFGCALTRIAAIFTFIPIPGARTGFDTARLLFILSLTLAMRGQWPQVEAKSPLILWMALILLRELALGLVLGFAIACLAEAVAMGFQILGLQAGYTFASTVDPTTQADSNILQVFGQLASGLLFFALGLHHDILRALAASLQTIPPGGFIAGESSLQLVVNLGRDLFIVGIRLALPVLVASVMLDITLALMGRINAQLQLLTIMFPVKMLATLGLLAAITSILPLLYGQFSRKVLLEVRGLIGI